LKWKIIQICTFSMSALWSQFANNANRRFKLVTWLRIKSDNAKTVNTLKSVLDASSLFIKKYSKLMCKRNSVCRLSHLHLRLDVLYAIWTSILESMAWKIIYWMKDVRTIQGNDDRYFKYYYKLSLSNLWLD
jgi:hypothetical protein